MRGARSGSISRRREGQMADRHLAFGKEVKVERFGSTFHVADCTDAETAERIARALGDRESIAAWLDAEGERRKTAAIRRTFKIIADAVRARLDEPDEPAPAGVRARYNEEAARD